jgi:hypothetical protein
MFHRSLTAAALCLTLLVACNGDDSSGNGAGSLHVRVTPASSPLDPDGFAARLDDGSSRPIPGDGELALEGLLPGEHTVELTDVDTPCVVTTENPLTVEVVGGDVVTASFTVACEHTGFIQVRTETTGEDPDPNGYFLDVDGATAPSIGVNATATLAVGAGDHDVTISDIADNCTVLGGEGATHTVAVVAGQTAHTTFEVDCVAVP